MSVSLPASAIQSFLYWSSSASLLVVDADDPMLHALCNACVHRLLHAFLCKLQPEMLPADNMSCHSAGDVRCVLARAADSSASTAPKAVVLTKEHKAIFPAERKRIEKAGGVVTSGRLQGQLCMAVHAQEAT